MSKELLNEKLAEIQKLRTRLENPGSNGQERPDRKFNLARRIARLANEINQIRKTA
jgi:hypothetical protein